MPFPIEVSLAGICQWLTNLLKPAQTALVFPIMVFSDVGSPVSIGFESLHAPKL
jgi:hypothetical protein